MTDVKVKNDGSDRIETHHSNLESSRTIVFWCYWLTTNNITALLTNQGQSLTIYNSLWCSVTVINNPFHDYTLLFICWWLWSTTWLLYWGQTIIDDISQNVNKSIGPCEGIRVLESVKCLLVESGILGFGIRNTAQGIRNPTKDWNPIQGSTRKKWNQVPGIRNPRVESRIQDCLGFPNMRRKAAHVKNYCLCIY